MLGITLTIGASKPSQILDNVKAIENTVFSEEELKRIAAESNIQPEAFDVFQTGTHE